MLVYRLDPGAEVVTPRTQAKTIALIRSRLRSIGVAGAAVAHRGDNEITVSLPEIADPDRVRKEVGTTAQLDFYDWEPSLIGRERTIGAHPGRQPPAAALREAQSEWRAAGRTGRDVDQLIFDGAFPSAYGAVKLASEQKPIQGCSKCSKRKPTFYLFSEDDKDELISGPVSSKRDLYVSATGGKLPHRGEVVEVPVGTVVVSELPQREGLPIKGAEPGWYALAGEPALTGSEITNPEEKSGESGEPVVVFEFTDSGRKAFHEVTRQIARRGREEALGVPSPEAVEELSGHLAVVLDNEVKTRPIINFKENPDGIDGRTGAQISGGFSGPSEAKGLASVLRSGALPVQLVLVAERTAG